MSRWILALVGVAALAGSGCMKLEQEVTINADGSADVKLRYGMSEQTLAMMEEMKKNPNAKVQTGGPDLTFDEAKIKADFEKKKAEGVELKSCKVETKDGWKYATLELHCNDLAAATKAGESTGQKGGYSLTKNADGNYVLEMAGAKGMGGKPGKEESPEAKAEQQKMMKAMMAGLRVSMKFNLPGKVIETTAPEKDERSVSWVLDISDDKFFEKSEEMEKKGAKVTFSGKGLNLKEVKAPAKTDEKAPEKKSADF